MSITNSTRIALVYNEKSATNHLSFGTPLMKTTVLN